MIPGAAFESHDGQQWTILSYPDQDNVEIENRWYPRLTAKVSLYDIRRSIYAWIEPIQQVVPAAPAGVDYGVQRVKVLDGIGGDAVQSSPTTNNRGGW
jgi:hypothetical protein